MKTIVRSGRQELEIPQRLDGIQETTKRHHTYLKALYIKSKYSTQWKR